VEYAVAADVVADDLVRVVDALRNGLDRAQRVVERGVCSVVVDVAVELAGGLVRADDVAEVVDAVRLRVGRHRHIERGVGSAAVEEAVPLGVVVEADDLVRGVDAESFNEARGRGWIDVEKGAHLSSSFSPKLTSPNGGALRARPVCAPAHARSLARLRRRAFAQAGPALRRCRPRQALFRSSGGRGP